MNEVVSYQQCLETYSRYFKGTDFGSTDFPKIVLGGLEKVVQGYANGRTLELILLKMGLVERKRDEFVLTRDGLAEIYALRSFKQTETVSKALALIQQLQSENAELKINVEEMETENIAHQLRIQSTQLETKGVEAQLELTQKHWRKKCLQEEKLVIDLTIANQKLEKAVEERDAYAKAMAIALREGIYPHKELVMKQIKQALKDVEGVG